MDTAWIQIFVLTFSECVAPAGKTVCQQQQFELEFLSRRDCEYALEQLLAIKGAQNNVIVDRSASTCTASARQAATYADVETLRSAIGTAPDDWRDPENAAARRAVVDAEHRARLDALKDCDATGGRAPCRVGDIIVEGAADGLGVEVWRRDD